MENRLRFCAAMISMATLLQGCGLTMTSPQPAAPSTVPSDPSQPQFPQLPPLAPSPQSTSAGPLQGSVPQSLPTAPTNSPPLLAGQQQGAPNPMTPLAQQISDKYGVRIGGFPDQAALTNLDQAMSLYPPGSVQGAAVDFTGQDAGTLGGTWQTGGVIKLYQTGVHTIAHEVAHHIIEENRARWGAQLKQYLKLDSGDFPQSPYALKNAQIGDFEEVAAETLSYYAEGKWRPANPQLDALLKAMLTNQPGATV